MALRARLLLLVSVVALGVACGDSMPNEPQGHPAWLDGLIAQIQAEPVSEPPTAIYSYQYRGETVYYRTSRCCDIRSIVYDAEGNVLCEPGDGVDGGGDGRCPDFVQTRTEERLIFQDPRS